MNLSGGPLKISDYDALERSWIPPELADAAFLRRVNSTHYLAWRRAAARYRLRRDTPDVEHKDGALRDKARYLSPLGRSGMLYFAPATDPKLMQYIWAYSKTARPFRWKYSEVRNRTHAH